MLQRIHIIVALIAALTVTILSLYQDITFYQMCVRLVVIIPSFFIFGLFFRAYMTKLLAPPPDEIANDGDPSEESKDDESESDEGNPDNLSNEFDA